MFHYLAELDTVLPFDLFAKTVVADRLAIMRGAAKNRCRHLYLLPFSKPLLPPGFVDHHRHHVGQIQAAIAGQERQPQAVFLRESVEQILW